jgi:hypothetical protein
MTTKRWAAAEVYRQSASSFHGDAFETGQSIAAGNGSGTCLGRYIGSRCGVAQHPRGVLLMVSEFQLCRAFQYETPA